MYVCVFACVCYNYCWYLLKVNSKLFIILFISFTFILLI